MLPPAVLSAVVVCIEPPPEPIASRDDQALPTPLVIAPIALPVPPLGSLSAGTRFIDTILPLLEVALVVAGLPSQLTAGPTALTGTQPARTGSANGQASTAQRSNDRVISSVFQRS
jgi:hypothetical protein